MFSDIANSDRLDNVRNELLSVHGIGPETADAILLYAGSAQTFVIDAYARRVLSRHGWAIAGASYAKLKAWCESQLPQNVQIYNEFHALLVHVGREHCRSRTPSCEGCPLQPLLPNSGPISDRVAS